MNITTARLKEIIKEEIEMGMSQEDKPEIDIDAESYGLSPQLQVAKYLSDPKTWEAYQTGIMADNPYLSPMWWRPDWEEVLDEWADEIKLDGRSVFGGYPSPTKPPPDAVKSFVDFAKVLTLGSREKGMFDKHDKFKDAIRWILAVIDEKTAGYGNQADEGWREMYQGLHDLYYNKARQIGKIDQTHFNQKRSQYLNESSEQANKIREMVLKETQSYFLDMYINEALDKIFEQDKEGDEDDEIADYKKAKRQAMFDKIKKGAMAAGVMGGVIGGIQSGVSDLGQQKADASAERQSQNIAAANTDEAQLEDFADQLNNRYRFLWGKGNDIAVYYPGTDGKVTVLPPSYSIAVQAFLDKKANAKRMEQGLPPILRYGEIDYTAPSPATAGAEYKGDFEDNVDAFLDEYSGDMIDAMAVLGAVPELQAVAGSGTEEMIVMAHPGAIDSNYYLPAVGMTVQQYYDTQYGGFMGDQERAAIEDAPDEEMVVTPDDGPQLNPELIRKSKERAANLKENKITWRNYKNRKKKLA